MKLRTRDVGLLALGFVSGAVVTAWLSSAPAPVPVASSALFQSTQLYAVALPPRDLTLSNLDLRLPPRRFAPGDSFDPPSALRPPERRALDLIDLRYQPDVKPEDLTTGKSTP